MQVRCDMRRSESPAGGGISAFLSSFIPDFISDFVSDLTFDYISDLISDKLKINLMLEIPPDEGESVTFNWGEVYYKYFRFKYGSKD